MSSYNITPNFIHTDKETAEKIRSDSAKIISKQWNKPLNAHLIVLDIATNSYGVGLNTNEISTIVDWIIKGVPSHV